MKILDEGYARRDVKTGPSGTKLPLPKDVHLAGFWRRGFAIFLDWLLVVIILSFTVWPLQHDLHLWSDMAYFDSIAQTGNGAAKKATLKQFGKDYAAVVAFLPYAYALLTIPGWLFFATTPGKWLLRMKIMTKKGQRPKLSHLVLRLAGYGFSILTFGAGFMWIGMSGHKQGLHDLLAGTLVVKKL